jgi:hypothetical protein
MSDWEKMNAWQPQLQTLKSGSWAIEEKFASPDHCVKERRARSRTRGEVAQIDRNVRRPKIGHALCAFRLAFLWFPTNHARSTRLIRDPDIAGAGRASWAR